MLFNSLGFLIFFPVVVLAYYVLPMRVKKLWLLFASYFFYMGWNVKYGVLLFLSTLITYISGLTLEIANRCKLDEAKRKKYKNAIVIITLVLNFSFLFFFKYIGFAANIFNKIFYFIHIQIDIPVFDVILPVGISFYTFQALSYTIDVYRGDICAEKSFTKYALFVSFFPQLVAGPIERSKNLLNQLAEPSKFSLDQISDGLLMMLWGFFLKLVLADRMAIFVDEVYGNYKVYDGWYLIVATLLFSFQIYCDFYGYSVIAKGAARILGINLMENFNAPYFSTSVGEFWRRWHISLTSWFRDYLYIPLGGGRKGRLCKYLNKFIVFLISGLWHGARASYIVWGGREWIISDCR